MFLCLVLNNIGLHHFARLLKNGGNDRNVHNSVVEKIMYYFHGLHFELIQVQI